MGRTRLVEAEWAVAFGDLAALLGPALPANRAPRVLGLFAHPDDEVFCAGGTLARFAAAGAVTGLVSLTQGESGQIRDAAVASRRTLGPVRAKELDASAHALGVDHVTCLDLGDGRLTSQPLEVMATVRGCLEDLEPDLVITFGPDGGFGHPDHVASCLATLEAVRRTPTPARVLHAKFPARGQLMVDTIVQWLGEQSGPFAGSASFGHALKLFADGTSMLGVSSDHVRVEWFPPGSYIIEQGEAPTELFCILSGTADVVVEFDDGDRQPVYAATVGSFVGEEGLATGRPRNAHVIARDAVTCLVLAPEQPSPSAGRGEGAAEVAPDWMDPGSTTDSGVEDCLLVNVRSVLDQKVAALAAHRSQYALEPDLLPPSMLERLLGTERFVVAAP